MTPKLALVGLLAARAFAQSSLDLAAITNPEPPEIQPGAKGSVVLRAQILLARAHFSCGELDASFGADLQTVVRAFQREYGLVESGAIDEDTWHALGNGGESVLTSSVIAMEDIPAGSDGTASSLETLAERYHVTPGIMHALNPHVDFRRTGQQLTVPNLLMAPPGAAARVIISGREHSIRTVDASGRILSFYVGAPSESAVRIRLTTWDAAEYQSIVQDDTPVVFEQ